nr:hypothetical protein [Parafrankia sp. CH37]
MPDDAVADSVDSPDSDSPYSVLPAAGPYGVAIGSALITMVEPHPGAEAEYNRWYEDDHFYAGAMAMPWMFAGRRWVAPRALQALREPADSAVARPLEAGKYIAVYWLTRGRHRDHMRWTVATNQRLNADGRIFHRRDHVFTAFQDYLGAVYRDGRGGALDIHALDHPYGGLVVEVVDAVGEALVDEAAAGTAGATGVGDAAGVAGVGAWVARPSPLSSTGCAPSARRGCSRPVARWRWACCSPRCRCPRTGWPMWTRSPVSDAA